MLELVEARSADVPQCIQTLTHLQSGHPISELADCILFRNAVIKLKHVFFDVINILLISTVKESAMGVVDVLRVDESPQKEVDCCWALSVIPVSKSAVVTLQ